MNVWFYAPLKAPIHRSPSGDRRVAQLLGKALRGRGHRVTLASGFRSFERDGDQRRQRRLQCMGRGIAARLVRRARHLPKSKRPQIWLTYHLYHKAPDWLGPAVSNALQIPYVLLEASYASKQMHGPWSLGLRASAQALASADAVIALNRSDLAGVQPLLGAHCETHFLRPFTEVPPLSVGQHPHRPSLAERHGLDVTQPWLLCVAMMRVGDKLASYELLAEALAIIEDMDWQLLIVGDGVCRQRIEARFERFGKRVAFAGLLGGRALEQCYSSAEILVWPAINEAFGMALLEAQAAGLAVVAGRSGGVADIVEHETTGILCPAGDPQSFSAAVGLALSCPQLRRQMGENARAKVRRQHSLSVAGRQLGRWLNEVIR